MIYVRLFAVAGPEVLRADSRTLLVPPPCGLSGRKGRFDGRHTRKSTCHILILYYCHLSQSFAGRCNISCFVESAKNLSRTVHTKYRRVHVFVCIFLVIREKRNISPGSDWYRRFRARGKRTIAIPVTSAGRRWRAPLVEEHGTRAQ